MTTTQPRAREVARGLERAILISKRILRPAVVGLRKAWVGAVFDRRYGVRTEEHIDLGELGVAAPGRVSYVPTGRHVLPSILSRRDVGPADVFLDAGSGMGRIVLQAALKYPVRRVIGVEISEELHRIAQTNLARNRHRLRAADVDLVNTDISSFEIPDDVSIVFLYNPFTGEILKDFIDRLVDSVNRCPRRVRVLYINPEDEASLVANGHVVFAGKRRAGRWLVHQYEVLGSA
jgi:hypothetical protein